ncbi:MAG: hypothetical protein HDS60_06115 [Barnesiella sp.]|nr:hypothetical protein [Barnesiella sp.]
MILNILLALLPLFGSGENTITLQADSSLKDETGTVEEKQYYVQRLSEMQRVCDFECDGLFYEFADGDNVTLVRENTALIDHSEERPVECRLQMAYERDENVCYTGDITVPDSVEYDGKKYRVAYLNPFALSLCKGLRSITFTSSFEEQILHCPYNICCFTCNLDLTSITYPDDMTEIIGQIYISPSLTDVHFPKRLSKLFSTIRYCDMTEVDLDNHDPYNPAKFSIDYRSLYSCENLARIKMPECDTLSFDGFNCHECRKVEQIVFRPCSVIEMLRVEFLWYSMKYGLKKMTIVSEASVPPEVLIYDTTGIPGSFDSEFRTNSILYVPDEAMEAYREAYYWRDFGEIRPMSEYLREENAAIEGPVCEAAEMSEPQVSLRSDRGELHITASTPTELTVWSLQGLPLWRGTVMDEAAVTLPAGVYIVTTPTSSRKYHH